MTNQEWTWARLNREQIGLLHQAEATLGADILLAYRSESQPQAQAPAIVQMGLHVAALNESQLECLQGLEAMMQVVVIAYQQSAASV